MPRVASRIEEVPSAAPAPVRFGLSAPEAAEAIGIGITLFLQMTEDGRMPRPRVIGARRVYDVDEVRTAFKALPHDRQAEPTDPADEWVMR